MFVACDWKYVCSSLNRCTLLSSGSSSALITVSKPGNEYALAYGNELIVTADSKSAKLNGASTQKLAPKWAANLPGQGYPSSQVDLERDRPFSAKQTVKPHSAGLSCRLAGEDNLHIKAKQTAELYILYIESRRLQ